MATLEDMFEEYDGQLYLHVGLNAAITSYGRKLVTA